MSEGLEDHGYEIAIPTGAPSASVTSEALPSRACVRSGWPPMQYHAHRIHANTAKKLSHPSPDLFAVFFANPLVNKLIHFTRIGLVSDRIKIKFVRSKVADTRKVD